jgi:hypothetical protein
MYIFWACTEVTVHFKVQWRHRLFSIGSRYYGSVRDIGSRASVNKYGGRWKCVCVMCFFNVGAAKKSNDWWVVPRFLRTAVIWNVCHWRLLQAVVLLWTIGYLMLIATKVAVWFFAADWHFPHLRITRALIVPASVFYDM